MKTIPIADFPAYRIREDGILETNWRCGQYYPGMPCEDCWIALPLKQRDDGYIPVCLTGLNQKRKRTYIHILMALAFIGPKPFSKACVRHLNGDATDNSITNLAWGTYKSNEEDKILHQKYYKSRLKGAKLSIEIVKSIRGEIAQKISDKDLAVKYKVSRPTITRIRNNVIWVKDFIEQAEQENE